MANDGGLVPIGDQTFLRAVAKARLDKTPVYVHQEWQKPAPETCGQIGWMKVPLFGWVRMIYTVGIGWLSYYDEWPDCLEEEPRISLNA